MKKINLVLFFLFSMNISFAQNYEWAKSVGSNAYDAGTCQAMDSSGNVNITGHFPPDRSTTI